MKEYNLKDNTVGGSVPTEYGSLKATKNFLKLELTPAEAKVLGEIRDFWLQEVDFSELRDFMYQDVDFGAIKDFWCQDVDFKAVKDFWCQDVDFGAVKDFWFQEIKL